MHGFLRTIAISALALCFSELSLAQTSTDLVKNSPAEQYEVIKMALLPMIDRNVIHSERISNNHIDLADCDTLDWLVDDDTQKGDNISYKLAWLAYDILKFEAMLSDSGYPRSLWKPLVDGYEAVALRRIIRGGKELDDARFDMLSQWARTLNSYRSLHSNKFPEVVAEGGCGGGGVSASFKSQPPNARILFIPAMYYSLCRAQGLNPNDENGCDRWKEVFAGQEIDVAGDYKVKLIWPGQAPALRSFSASKLDFDAKNIITLR